jgi:hypothetical protein
LVLRKYYPKLDFGNVVDSVYDFLPIDKKNDAEYKIIED